LDCSSASLHHQLVVVVCRAFWRYLNAFVLLLALPGCQRYWVCDEQAPARSEELPRYLSAAGLYADLESDALAPGVSPYRPQFALWSDGAEKRRWIFLPPDGVIDTSDMDDWRFPRGSKLWKEFSVSGKRVETRLLYKAGTSDDDWIALSYVWNDSQTDAIAAPWGAVDVRGDHDVPAAGECMACHAGRRGRVLGFSAIQLAEPADAPPNAEEPVALDLHALISDRRLSDPPVVPLEVPGNPVERAALGYLHANCSHCHNQDRPARKGARCFDPRNSYDFTLSVSALDSPQSTPVYRTAVGAAFAPGNPNGSKAIELISDRGMFKQMPPLATERVDTEAVANLRAWVQALP
jgi:hypothetical protein